MYVFVEESSRQKEIIATLTPSVAIYAETFATHSDLNVFIKEFAEYLEKEGYLPNELKNLDKKALLALVKSWKPKASVQMQAVIKRLFHL